MSSRAENSIRSGVFLIFLSGSLLAQAPVQARTDPRSPAVSTVSSLARATVSPGNKPHNNSFVIGNDDVLAVNVWKEPDLSRSFPVRSDGRVSLPLVGEIQAAGRTPMQLEQDITGRLRSYMTEPEVTVMVEKINSEKFNILGQVAKPGAYSLTEAATVMDAIALAGGFRDFAKKKAIKIIRLTPDGGETRLAFNYKDFIEGKNPSQNMKLEPSDTIVVP
jgi:polysaccharide export outer membrane protein